MLYDGAVNFTQRQLPSHGMTSSLSVVGGVLRTLFGLLLIEGLFLIALLCFVASGTPMVIGRGALPARTGGRMNAKAPVLAGRLVRWRSGYSG